MQEAVVVRGAREHNLRNVSLRIPHGRLVVFTGVSGSGKSSLAFDTLYAEGQRRYLASLSSYARQFLDQLPRPDVDAVLGLPPALSIDQKSVGHNPRSTVGTLTEVYDFLRVIWARVGELHCPHCDHPVGAQGREAIVRQAIALHRQGPLLFLAPLVRDQRGSHRELLADLRKRGYLRVRADGEIVRTDERRELDPRQRHTLEVVVDRLGAEPEPESRIWEAVDAALALGKGQLLLLPAAGEPVACSSTYTCPRCGTACVEPTPASLSFNVPQGWCPTCRGMGRTVEVVEEWLVPDPERSIAEGALAAGGDAGSARWRPIYQAAAEHLGFTLDTPWKALGPEQRHGFLYGIPQPIPARIGGHRVRLTFAGVIPWLLGTEEAAAGDPESPPGMAPGLRAVSREVTCPSCHGARLRPESLAVRFGGRNIAEAAAMTIVGLARFLEGLQLPADARAIAGEALQEVGERLHFLMDVGVDYLTLDRPAPSLSGGEAQRIRLAAQLGRGLSGVLYVLDEPSIGLHQRDNRRLIQTLQRLRDRGSTVIVVEHDEETIRCADHVVDFGPGAGREGGCIVAAGTPEEVAGVPESITGAYLAGTLSIPVPAGRRSGRPGLRLVGARAHNLKDITVEIPAGALTVVTGVSGSGKSTLVRDVLLTNVARALGGTGPDAADTDEGEGRATRRRGGRGPGTPSWDGCRAIEGLERFDKVIAIDQSPIGRIPRSNPATYTKVWDAVRAFYAELPEARLRGYAPGRFSFNVPGGRCPVCEGNGARRIDMDFLADVWVPCEACGGSRFNEETLQVRHRGRSIADLLALPVREALSHFRDVPSVARALQTLEDVGLGYMRLGQPSPTLSGGEAQRVKLARELSRRPTGRTLYVLDEPTTGLHAHDVACLLRVLQRLVDAGNTVVVVEHNLDVVKVADRVIDLGPEGGDAGGQLLATGTPEEVARTPGSLTGHYLREVLELGHIRGTPRPPRALDSAAESLATTGSGASAAADALVVVGARQNNLRNVSLRLPKECVIAFAGPSGAGKTSLALDTIYAEGQRRYVESLSAYARQFLGRAPRPAVDRIEGLCPAIAVDQRAVPANSRSTVGTLTETYDYLRLLFARAGEPFCPACGGPVAALSARRIATLAAHGHGSDRLRVLAPAAVAPPDLASWQQQRRRDGYARFWYDGAVLPLDTPAPLTTPDGRGEGVHGAAQASETGAAWAEAAPDAFAVALVVDRVPADDLERLAEAVEAALRAGEGAGRGVVGVQPDADGAPVRWWRQGLACARCGAPQAPLSAHTFAFNDPRGWCPVCEGTGVQRGGDWDTLVPNPRLSIAAGGIGVLGPVLPGPPTALLRALGQRHGFDLHTPLGRFTPAQREVLLHGDPLPLAVDLGGGQTVTATYVGLTAGLEFARSQTLSGEVSGAAAALLSLGDCGVCGGSRLGPQGRAVRLGGRTLPELLRLPLHEARAFFDALSLPPVEEAACGELLREVRGRLRFLCEVGLEYLTLGRSSAALSGGEGQRIRLASQLGSGLTGVLYVLDEPTVGLHPRDTQRLLQSLRGLQSLGNTVLTVEHDEQVLAAADHLVAFGPGSGSAGGRIVAAGRPDELAQGDSAVGQWLRGEREAAVRPRRAQRQWLLLRGARLHNLQRVDAAFPLGNLVAITGVSGSGKTSLVVETLYRDLARRLHRAQAVPGPHDGIDGASLIDKVIRVDQEPIGDSPRSNPATYTGIFDTLRGLYARVPEARARGMGSDHFSYNHPEGRCDRCEGHGYRRIAMHFLPDAWVLCDACAGRRYRAPVLEVLYRGLSIADCLELTVEQALGRFHNLKSIRPTLEVLQAVGLGYLRLGQPAPTLSAGEAQRLKLARELARPGTGSTLYVLDEPTTGLSPAEVTRLLLLLHRLVDAGNTVLCIEHNLDVIAAADWVIDMGPEGGAAGGHIVAAGPPEAVAASPDSRTAPFLRAFLAASEAQTVGVG
jgi:excinuclease ABC subunit A